MDTRTFDTRTLRIRELNDSLRAHFPISNDGGAVFFTKSVMGCVWNNVAFWNILVKTVREFDGFTDDNDPHGEHDMAFFECGGLRLFWKIDYYDHERSGHSPDEADPAVTTRILTVGAADEY